ncbi:MAG: hypothetical protein LBH34_04545 [Prevotellaceae bacterium]|jgi:hypothetical protein|nr:hypothetical protein [Prevotellaceae bacterium]
MKKIIFALMLSLPIVFISCSNDDDPKFPESIINTEWSTTIPGAGECTISFTDASNFTVNVAGGSIPGTYTYTPPTITAATTVDPIITVTGEFKSETQLYAKISMLEDIELKFTKK